MQRHHWLNAQLRCMYTNTCSTGNKQEELEAIVLQESCAVVAITETSWDDPHDWSAAIDSYPQLQALQKGQASWVGKDL
ncbi:hypothetical protein BTVI_07247 [Pitangus sulphuratus]|nr:hypothetical protein BTVI_07247 [Pitangus sulphuratus]